MSWIRNTIVILISLGLMSCSWATRDKILAGSFIVSKAIDMTQTWEIMDDSNDFYEINPLLNSLSREEAMWVMGGTGLVILGGAHFFEEWRTPILITGNAISWGFVIRNDQIGVNVSW